MRHIPLAVALLPLIIKGFGESQPIAPNEKPDGSDNPEGRKEKRRVEIVVEKGG